MTLTRRWRRLMFSAALAVAAVTGGRLALRPAEAHYRSDASLAAVDPADLSRAMDLTARYLNGRTDYTTPMLGTVGFDPEKFVPPLERGLWRSFPAHRKIAVAYLFAEAHDPGKGGEAFMAALHEAMAREYDTFRRVAAPGQAKPEVKGPVGFSRPAREDVLKDVSHQIPEQTLAAINEIGDYLSRSTMGSPATFVAHHTMADEERVFRAFIDSDTYPEALKKVVASLPEDRQEAAVRSMVNEVRRENESARAAPAFAMIEGPHRVEPGPKPPPEDPAPPPPPARPKVPPRGGPSPAGARYEDVIKKDYSKEGESEYSDMIKKVKGFGGIILGNTVRAEGLGRPVSLRCVARPGSDKADLVVEVEGGEALTMPGVSAEDAYLAYRIVCTKVPGVPQQWSDGRGIGLVSVFGEFTFRDARNRDICEACSVTLHPALVDRDLGYAAIMLDSMPLNGRRALADAAEKYVGEGARSEVEKVLRPSRFRRSGLISLMFVNVPLRLHAEGKTLHFERDDEVGRAFSPEHRRKAFLELRLTARDGDGFDQDLRDEFYELTPTLLRSSYDLNRINRFVAVAALYRWVASSSGTRIEPPAEPEGEKVTTPDAVGFSLLGLGGGEVLKPIDIEEARKTRIRDAR